MGKLLAGSRKRSVGRRKWSLSTLFCLLFLIIGIIFFVYLYSLASSSSGVTSSSTDLNPQDNSIKSVPQSNRTKVPPNRSVEVKPSHESINPPSKKDLSRKPPQQTPPPLMKVAFAITITKDGKFQDGAAVLAYSIIESFKNDPVEISFVAFVHPDVSTSRPYLRQIGYSVIETPTPINVSAIQGKFLREHINDKAGCCGAAELIKLYSYRLIDFDWVVHLDADVIVTQSFMELFSLNKSLIYTTDPNMASHKGEDKMPVQGGFLIIKPSLEDYHRLIDVMMVGDYRSGSAWGGTQIGWFWGGKTIQGVLAYYYNRLNPPERSLRVDRCIYNTMADTEPCWSTDIKKVKSAHFTVCQKPWNCHRQFSTPLCGELHRRWRSECHDTAAYFNLSAPTSCCSNKGNYVPLPLSEATIPANQRFSLNCSPQLRQGTLSPLPGAGFVDIDTRARENSESLLRKRRSRRY